MDHMSSGFTCFVKKEWVDYNGHMNDAEYAKVFSLALDKWMEEIGLNAEARERYAYTIFTLETHLCYLMEAHENEKITVSLQLLDVDAKRVHAIFMMNNQDGQRIATSEQMLMGMDTATNRPAPFPEVVNEKIMEVYKIHEQLDRPKQAGRTIGIKR
ncbi:thioesterase family protein [Oceanobacillus saliphilus]|uniref:thioesterase family protein n=1 Tax=Oceanobacillus saliphilus TaxID=2925834 RepID=UPI00201D4BA3|nr:thioesterase family protein [Oceanobacillus saliphilus]